MKKRIIKIKFLLIGINAEIDLEDTNWKQRTKILLGGPLINLIILLIALLIYKIAGIKSSNINFLIILNLYLLLLNLLPILPLDGGEILKGILTNNLGLFLGSKYLRIISYCLSGMLIIVGFFQMTTNVHNLSLMVIGIYIFINLKIGNFEGAFMNIKYIMFRRAKLLKRGIYAARDLVALKSTSLGEIIKALDYDRFHFIYVLDENLNLLKVFSEKELIEGMLKYNIELTLGELIKKSDV